MKVSKENMVLHLPFDDEIGSAKAYNYAPNRTVNNDAVLSEDCELTENAVFGKALRMPTTGAECVVNENLVEYNGEFTVCAFIKSKSDKLIFSLDYNVEQSQTYEAKINPLQWNFVAIQRIIIETKHYVRFILNEVVIYNEVALGVPNGISIANNDITDTDEVIVDDLRIYNRGLSLAEIFSLQNENDDVEYYVDGVNFKTFGVEVSKSEGLLDALERKNPLRVEWDSYHGEVIDLSRPHWKQREITLECFIVASSNTAFVRSLNRFISAFQKYGTQRLTCEYAGTVKPLEYDVYRNDRVEIDKTWNDELMVGTFSIALIEPQPIKMVLKHICQDENSMAWFKCKSNKMLTITWGDGDDNCIINDTEAKSKSSGIHGTPVKISHRYATAGEYNIVIHGNMETVTDFETNCIMLYGPNGNI